VPIDQADPKYRKALELIRAGQAELVRNPESDQPGFVPCPKDQRREAKYAARRDIERRFREATRSGDRLYVSEFQPNHWSAPGGAIGKRSQVIAVHRPPGTVRRHRAAPPADVWKTSWRILQDMLLKSVPMAIKSDSVFEACGKRDNRHHRVGLRFRLIGRFQIVGNMRSVRRGNRVGSVSRDFFQ
jgi:hypothetical protein